MFVLDICAYRKNRNCQLCKRYSKTLCIVIFQVFEFLECCWNYFLTWLCSRRNYDSHLDLNEQVGIISPIHRFFLFQKDLLATNNVPIRVKQHINADDIQENDSVMTCNRTILSIANTPKKMHLSLIVFN